MPLKDAVYVGSEQGGSPLGFGTEPKYSESIVSSHPSLFRWRSSVSTWRRATSFTVFTYAKSSSKSSSSSSSSATPCTTSTTSSSACRAPWTLSGWPVIARTTAPILWPRSLRSWPASTSAWWWFTASSACTRSTGSSAAR